MLPPHRGGPASGSATPRGRSQAVGGAAPYRGGQVAGGAAPCRGLEVRGSGSIGSSRRGRKVVPGSGEGLGTGGVVAAKGRATDGNVERMRTGRIRHRGIFVISHTCPIVGFIWGWME
jgi:hypothetical protein